MSLQTRPIPPTPELTAQVARRAFRKGNVSMSNNFFDLLLFFVCQLQWIEFWHSSSLPLSTISFETSLFSSPTVSNSR